MAQYERYVPNSTIARGGVAVDEGLRKYMLSVYNYMALGVAGTAVVTLLIMNNLDVMRVVAVGPGKWVLFAGILGLGWFAPKLFYGGSAAVGQIAYWAYCAMWGALIAPMVYVFFAKGAGVLVGKAFFIAAATFAATSAIGYTTKKDMTGWGGFIQMASIGLIIASLASFFFINDPGTSKMLSLGISCLVVLLFAAATAWETQQIKDMYVQGAHHGGEDFVSRSAVFGAFMLYGSFVTLFVHILNILGILSND